MSIDAVRQLHDHRRVWDLKPALRAVYGDMYDRIGQTVRQGRILELGAGPGQLVLPAARVIRSDIVHLPWLDLVADASALPFEGSSLDSIVMVDVLHHVSSVRMVLGEILRVLRPGGRIVMVEPAITPVSWLFYRFFHPEPVRLTANPLGSDDLSGDDPFDANQAIPTLLFQRRRGLRALERALPALHVARVEPISLFAYPLSGGYRSWSLLPERLVPWILRLEQKLLPWFGRLMAFRVLVVLERATSMEGHATAIGARSRATDAAGECQ